MALKGNGVHDRFALFRAFVLSLSVFFRIKRLFNALPFAFRDGITEHFGERKKREKWRRPSISGG